MSAILGDEMGLDNTLQSIAFIVSHKPAKTYNHRSTTTQCADALLSATDAQRGKTRQPTHARTVKL